MTAEAEDTPTDLRHDLDYLKRMLEVAIRLHRPANMEEVAMLADILHRVFIRFRTVS